GFARFASFFSIQMTDEGELHMLSFANHAAAFFRISRSIFKRRFSSSNSFNRARSSISSGFSLKSPRFFAAFIQFPNVPSLIPRSRAISAIGLPELINNSTASALNSGVNFRRVEPITVLLLVDNHSTSVTVYGSDRPPVAHLGDPAEIAGLRGPKKRAKTDRADARLLRTLLVEGRFPESWIPPAHV